ncbi:MAG: biopolymer transporter ExbD [Sphingomonas sp.]
MARAVTVREPQLFSTINVTPFIDVMLVLLIMLILTIPLATQKLPVELPQGRGAAATEPPHQLAIDRQGGLAWDGRRIADAELPALLARVKDTSDGVLHLRTDPEARYERFDSVLAMVKRAGIVRLGFVGDRPLED